MTPTATDLETRADQALAVRRAAIDAEERELVIKALREDDERKAAEAVAQAEAERRAKAVAADRKVAARQAAVAEDALQDLAGAVKSILALSNEAVPRAKNIITERIRFVLAYSAGLTDLRELRMPDDDKSLTETIVP